jgi:hypothetical protein
MRPALAFKILGVGLLAVAGFAGPSMPPARAQMAMPGSGGGRSLGGYGASAIGSYYGNGGSVYVPYSGNSHGFLPYRGGSGSGSGGGLGAAPIARRLPQTAIGGVLMADTPIGGASLSGAMGGDTRGSMSMKARSGRDRALLVPFGYEGGIGMGGIGGMPGTMGPRRMSPGPGFGSPFRMPIPLGGASSMAMP